MCNPVMSMRIKTYFDDLLELRVNLKIYQGLWWFYIWLKPCGPDFEYQVSVYSGAALDPSWGSALAKTLSQAFMNGDVNSAPKHPQDVGLSFHLQHPPRPQLWHVPKVTQDCSQASAPPTLVFRAQSEQHLVSQGSASAVFISGFAGSWKREAEGVVWFLSIDLGLSARLRLISSLSLIS